MSWRLNPLIWRDVEQIIAVLKAFLFSVFCPRRGAEWTPKVSPGTTFRTPKYRPNLASGGPIDGKSPSWKIRVFCNLPFISPVIIVFADVKALRFAVIPSPHPPPNLREHKSPALYRNSVSVISLDCLESPPYPPPVLTPRTRCYLAVPLSVCAPFSIALGVLSTPRCPPTFLLPLWAWLHRSCHQGLTGLS